MNPIMKSLRSAIAIFLMAAAVLFPFAQPVQAAGPFNVNTSMDSHDVTLGNGVCADLWGDCSLRAAIEEANTSFTATTINLPAGTYLLAFGSLYIAPDGGRTIVIAGAGAATTIIQPMASDTTNRVIYIDANSVGNTNVTISGVTIRNGHDGPDLLGGAGILAGSVSSPQKDRLTLQNCIITNNHNAPISASYTGQPGGGVFMNGGDLTVTNCTFSNNTSAASQGGAIAFLQPDSAAPAAVLTITGSTFTGNSLTNTSASGINGGGAVWINTIAANSGANAHSITSSTFINNSAKATSTGYSFGGAIYAQVGSTNITNSTFTGNNSAGTSGQGGAIYNDSGVMNISYSRLAGNTAAGGGSGIYNHGSNTAVTTAINNWWGCNGGPGAVGCDTTANDSVPGAITHTPWIVLSNTASPASINAAGAAAPNAATLTASFLKNSAGQVLTPANISVLIGLPVTWENALLGTLTNQQATIQANGTATATFTAGAQGGVGHADARVDSGAATANITIVPYADLSVTLADTPDPVTAGANLTYTLALSNTGPNAASTVSVTQSTPANTTFVSASVSTGTGWTISSPAVGGTGNVTFTKASMAAAETASMTIVVKVNASASNGSTITGTAAAASPVMDINLANNTASASTTVQTRADLVVTKTAPAQVFAGESLAYTITLTNNGSSDAQTVTLTDALPAGTVYVSQNQASGPQFTLSNTSSSVSNTIASLAAGASASFTVQTTVNADLDQGALLSNTANASTSTTDPNPASNASTASTTVNLKANLSVTKTAAATVLAGNNLTYNLSVTNLGPSKATSVALADSLPTGTTFVSQIQKSGPNFALSNTASTIINTLSVLPVNATATFEVVVKVNSNVLKDTLINNTASVSAASFDPVSANNSATAATTVNTQADLSVTKTGAAQAVAGGNLAYTLTVTNSGPSNAAAVSLQDLLPAGVTFVSQSLTGGPAFVLSNVGNSVNNSITSLAPNTPASCQVIVSINGNVLGGTIISNTASVASPTSDPVSNNNSAAAATTIQTPPAITSANHISFIIGTAGTFTITTSGYPTAGITQSGSLPSGITFTDNGNGTATLAGTPAVVTGGAYNLTITAQNGIGSDAVQAFTLNINAAPAITSADRATFALGESGLFTVTAPVFPLAAISETGALPSGVTFLDNGDGTAVLSGTPALGSAGPYPITITAANGVLPDAVQSFILTVTKATPLIAVATQPDPANVAQQVTLTATVSSALATPTGTVTFYIDGEIAGTGTLDAVGVATLVTGPLPSGNYLVRFVYGSDQNFATVEKSIPLTVSLIRLYLPVISR